MSVDGVIVTVPWVFGDEVELPIGEHIAVHVV